MDERQSIDRIEVIELDARVVEALFDLPGIDSERVRRWSDLETFHAGALDVEEGPHRVVVAATTAADLDVKSLRTLLIAPRRLELLVVLATATDEELVGMMRGGAGRVERLPLAPLPIDTLLSDRGDLALVFPGRVPGPRRETHEFRLPSRPDAISGVIRTLCQRADALGQPNEFVRAQLPLVLDEVVTNAMKHGHGWNEALEVDVRAVLTRDAIEIEVRDQGAGFERSSVADPLHVENRIREGGRGLFLIESMMDEVHYLDGGRTVRLRKKTSLDPVGSSV